MPTTPAVSIHIPAYKAERYLAETLESVRVQTHKDWELLVTEDGSRDGTEAIVRAFAATVSQPVRYLRHDPNRGLPATRNAGIELAAAPLIALLDADDLWLPEHLADLVSTARRTGADFVHAGSLLFDSDTGKELKIRAPDPEIVAAFPLSLFDARYVIQPASVLLTRALWAKVGGFDPAYRYVEDREMWLRCARSGARFVYTGRQTCRYRKHADALSNRAPEMAEFAAMAIGKHLDWEAIPRPLRVRLIAGAWCSAARLRQRRQPGLAARHYARAIAVSPCFEWRLRRLACLALGLFSSRPQASS